MDQGFEASEQILPINTTFAVRNGTLSWTNAEFTNGTVQFYKLPPGLLDNAQVLCKFLGPMEPHRSWSPIVLYADPANSVPTSTALSMSPGPVMASSPSSGVSVAFSGAESAAASSVESSAVLANPTPTYSGLFVAPTAVSRDGLCGGSSGEQCTGSAFGNCCSRYGYCGSTEDYCSTGCQVAFGNCDLSQYSMASMSSMTSFATSGSPAPVWKGASSSATPIFGDPGSVLSIAHFQQSCNDYDHHNQDYDDYRLNLIFELPSDDKNHNNNGIPANILCGNVTDAQGGGLGSVPVNGGGVSACLTACDSTSGCMAFTYVGDSTLTNGNCYLKQSAFFYTNTTFNIALGVLVASGSAAASKSTSTATATTLHTAATISTSTPISTSSPGASTSSSAVVSGAAAAALSSSTTAGSASSTTSSVTGGPTPCSFGDPPGTDEDDNYCQVNLPFEMKIFSMSDTATFPSTNGLLALGSGSAQYLAAPLPDPSIPPSTACPYFDDLYLYAARADGEGIYYTLDAANTTVLYEWVLSRGGTDERYLFSAFYDSAAPGVLTFQYAQTGGAGNQGATASVGVQGLAANGSAVAAVFSYDQADVPPGAVVVCDTNVGTCVARSDVGRRGG
ncbi:hypothetical protein MBLNU459_g4266t1 [Dothideomycetes sp. NU459]